MIWLYYGMNYGTAITTTFYGVEVTYTGRDALRDSQSLIISREETTSVTVKLTGSRRDISRLTSEDLKAVVNLSTVTNAGYRTMPYTISFPSSVNQSSITVSERTPQTVGLQISKLSTAPVEVRGRFEGSMAEGYVLDAAGMSFDPAYITLTGPEEELQEIDHAEVVVSRENVSASFSAAANYIFVNADGDTLDFEDVTSDAESVSVTVPVDLTKEVALDVSLIEGGGAKAQNVIKAIDPKSITLAGDAATLEGINTIYLATIDLSNYTSFQPTDYQIVLPNDTTNLSGVSTASVDLEFTGLETALYTVTNLDYANLSEGYVANVMDVNLFVTVRAPEGVLSQIEANNIRAVADLTGITSTSRAPVTIYVDGQSGAGAVGEYTMYVRVEPAPAATPTMGPTITPVTPPPEAESEPESEALG